MIFLSKEQVINLSTVSADYYIRNQLHRLVKEHVDRSVELFKLEF